MNPQTRNRIINLIVKCGVGAAFITILGWELFTQRDVFGMWHEFTAALSLGKLWLIVVVVLLIPANWLMEAMKWSRLMRPVHQVSTRDACKAVLGGIAVAIFTPNRIGEYGGRILFVPSKYNWYAVIATMTGSFAQILVIVFFGLIAGFWYVTHEVMLPGFILRGVQISVAMILLGALLVYFKLPAIAQWASEARVPRLLTRPRRAFGLLRRVDSGDLNSALGYSAVKYLIFTTQFVLLLMYFDVQVPLHLLYCGVALMYLLQTSIPLPPFFEIFMRGEFAILLWAVYEVNELSVLASSFFIWILNLVLPAFFGLAAISTVNVVQSLGYDNQGHKSGILAGGSNGGYRSAPGTPDDGTPC